LALLRFDINIPLQLPTTTPPEGGAYSGHRSAGIEEDLQGHRFTGSAGPFAKGAPLAEASVRVKS
jgi:hypothetical protein